MIRWNYLDEIVDQKRCEWDKESPIRYVLIDGMIEPGMCRDLADFSKISGKLTAPHRKLHKHVRGKSGTPDRAKMTELQKQFFDEVNSERFLSFIKKITGISPIYADAELSGGGLHQIRSGGYLNVHTDFNFDPKTMRNRRLNLLLYLNEGWKREWAGDIELWDEKLDRPFFSAVPEENRVLIFETDEKSFHGHPVPLECPPDVTRKSLAVYYYSDWPHNIEYRKDTGYQLTRLQWAQLMSKMAKMMAKRPMNEAQIVKSLELNYMTSDISIAYNALMNLRSARTIREDYWEYPDGQISLTGPEQKKMD